MCKTGVYEAQNCWINYGFVHLLPKIDLSRCKNYWFINRLFGSYKQLSKGLNNLLLEGFCTFFT